MIDQSLHWINIYLFFSWLRYHFFALFPPTRFDFPVHVNTNGFYYGLHSLIHISNCVFAHKGLRVSQGLTAGRYCVLCRYIIQYDLCLFYVAIVIVSIAATFVLEKEGPRDRLL